SSAATTRGDGAVVRPQLLRSCYRTRATPRASRVDGTGPRAPSGRWTRSGRTTPPPLEVRLHERIEVAVEHGVDVPGLVLGPQVLHHLVRLQDVAADLAAEADLLLVAPDLVQLGLAARPLDVGDLGLEHGHGPVAVLELAALDLARHDDPGRDVGEPHRGRRL